MKRDDNLISCPYCQSVNRADSEVVYCRNCKNRISGRKEVNLHTAWAMLITAMIFYVIANIYPILIVDKFHHQSANTIIGGVIALWEEGSYPIAIIIFIASVFVPLLKFILILYILLNYHKPQSGSKKVDQVKLYHLTEVIGPWSMVDVFVVSILVSVVHMNSVKILAGVGATAFVLMVFFTMLSAMAIDIRLMREESYEDRRTDSSR
jgi:paraquat-inducible protein A